MKKIYVALLVLVYSLPAFSKNVPDLIPYRRDTLWGYCDRSKNIVIELQFDDARPFINQRAAVKLHGFYFFINSKGERVGELYDEVEDFQEGSNVARVKKGGYWMLIDRFGNELIDPTFLYIREFNHNCAWAVDSSSRKWGVINARGEPLISFIYDYFNDFNHGYTLAGIYKNGSTDYVILNTTGKVISKVTYPFIGNYGDRRWIAKMDSCYGFINARGQVKIDFRFKNACEFSEKKAIVSTHKDELIVINKKGKKLFSIENYVTEYEDPRYHYNRLAVCRDGKWGYIDKNGKLVIECKYGACTSFSSGICSVKLNGKWILLDRYGKHISPLIFDENFVGYGWIAHDDGYMFDGELCRVISNGKPGYIDRKGNTYWQD